MAYTGRVLRVVKLVVNNRPIRMLDATLIVHTNDKLFPPDDTPISCVCTTLDIDKQERIKALTRYSVQPTSIYQVQLDKETEFLNEKSMIMAIKN